MTIIGKGNFCETKGVKCNYLYRIFRFVSLELKKKLLLRSTVFHYEFALPRITLFNTRDAIISCFISDGTLVPSVFVPLTSGRERTTLERSDLKSENSGLPVELRMPNVHCASFRRRFNIILLVSSPNPEINMAMAISSSATSLSDVEQQGVNFSLQVNRKRKCRS